MDAPRKGSENIDSVDSCGKLDEAMCSCDCTNETCGAYSNGSCKICVHPLLKKEKTISGLRRSTGRIGIHSQKS